MRRQYARRLSQRESEEAQQSGEAPRLALTIYPLPLRALLLSVVAAGIVRIFRRECR